MPTHLSRFHPKFLSLDEPPTITCDDTATLALLPTIEVVDELYCEVGSYLPPSLSGASHTHLHLITQQPRLLRQTSQSWKNEWH